MELITKEEFEKEAWSSRSGGSKVFEAVISLEVGQILRIEPEDWDKKYSPGAITAYIKKRYGREYAVRRHAGGKGWAVERLK